MSYNTCVNTLCKVSLSMERQGMIMKYSGDFYYEEEHGPNMVLVYMVFIMSVVVLLVTGLVFWQNKSHTKTVKHTVQSSQLTSEESATVKSVEDLISGSTLTSDQLDIWSLPDTGRGEDTLVDNNGKNGTVTNQTTGEIVSGTVKAAEETTANDTELEKTALYDMTQKGETAEETADSLDDGNHTLVTYQDGTQEWIELNPNLALNQYDTSKLVYQKPVMKYYEDGKQVSTFGVDIAGRLGTVDYSKLKKAGCNYVLIRIGARGYSSGQIVLDEKYKENLDGAKKAGLGIGVYFTSQAITDEEVSEEVDTLLEIIDEYPIDYPVILQMQATTEDMARIDALDIDDRTGLAKLFLSEIEEAGYKPMLYGTKEWLITQLDLEELSDFDVCLAQEEDVPDYPYEYTMWQYNTEGTVKGIEKPTKLIMSYLDYAE